MESRQFDCHILLQQKPAKMIREAARQRALGFSGVPVGSFRLAPFAPLAAFRISALSLICTAAILRSSCERVLSAAARLRDD
jgi:hypothetical protein